MKIVWFVSSLEVSDSSISSQIASVRIRCLEIVNALEKNHPDITVYLVELTEPLHVDTDLIAEADIAVIGKVFKSWSPVYEFLQQHNIPIVVDLCDDIFAMKHLTTAYEVLLGFSEHYVAASQQLAEHLEANTRQSAVVIADPQEGEKLPIKLPLHQPLQLAWFGQPANLSPLAEFLEAMRKQDLGEIELKIVTRMDDSVIDWLRGLQANPLPNIALEALPWSLETQASVLAECDAVIIPSNNDAARRVKTANRLMTAIWSGKPCIAYPVPSYEEFSDYVILDEDIVHGLQTLLATDVELLARRIEAGQAHIENCYNSDVLAEAWLDFFKQVIENKSKPGSVAEEPVRLNLGCGDKILPGYCNVDIVDERAGNQPDVVCDITDLKVFASNYADEILTVHVIEHFYYWEAEQVLREWVRVLKPGGKMIIECPNLLSACETILRDPVNAVGPGKEGQRSMWVLYGDPAWKDPLMCHKWLYTPHSLAQLMQSCGLVDVHTEAAQFKLREPRDMRLVGIKA